MTRQITRAMAAVALAAATIIASASPLSAQLLVNPFGRDSVGISAEDWNLMRNALGTVLAEYRVGATHGWKSPTTGRAGEWVMTRAYERDGMKCALLTHHFTAGPGFDYTAPMCLVAPGDWKLAF